MEFSGSNTITLSRDAVKEIVMQTLKPLIGDARITECDLLSYPTRLEITFTTDPEPAAEVVQIKDAA